MEEVIYPVIRNEQLRFDLHWLYTTNTTESEIHFNRIHDYQMKIQGRFRTSDNGWKKNDEPYCAISDDRLKGKDEKML